MKYKLKVVEIFNSIQGEGFNVGKSATFIRLANCNLNCEFCDTEWTKGVEMTLADILKEVRKYSSRMIIWTGGEPTLQLNDEIVAVFKDYYQAIETNGSLPVPEGIDYISCSPKVDPSVLKKNFSSVNEFRFPVVAGESLPKLEDLPSADHYFLSPVFEGEKKSQLDLNRANLNYCLALIEEDPRWRLSVQLHKLIHVH